MEAADDRVELKPVLARTSLSFVLSFEGPRALWPATPAAGQKFRVATKQAAKIAPPPKSVKETTFDAFLFDVHFPFVAR